MNSRRLFLAGSAATVLRSALDFGPARAAPLPITPADLRGSIDAGAAGLVPGQPDNQSRALQRLIDDAARRNMPLFLPPGRYIVSNLDLPDGARITGVAGATRLVYSGEGHMLRAEGARRVELADIVIDGANNWLADYAGALVSLRGVAEAILSGCTVIGSRRHAVQLERCGGRVERCAISGAAQSGLYCVEGLGVAIRDNRVSDCGNGGILVHRWAPGPDGAMVTGNRVERIAARDGGTGQNGNGINIFRADGVIVANNHVSDCAFSAIRANSASNIQIRGNTCLASGETALYCEFGFTGAVIADNLIDKAANGILVVNLDVGGRLATVSGNLVRDLTLPGPYRHDGQGFGFGIAVEADTVVSGNVVEKAAKWGMLLGWGPFMRGVVATGNMIREAPVGIAVSVAEGAGPALISGNAIAATPKGAIIGYRWNEAATGELAGVGVAGSTGFPHLTITGNRVD